MLFFLLAHRRSTNRYAVPPVRHFKYPLFVQGLWTLKVQQVVEKDWSMLRHAQHERILIDNFKTHSARPELGRRTPNGFQQPVKVQCSRSNELNVELGTLNLEQFVSARDAQRPAPLAASLIF